LNLTNKYYSATPGSTMSAPTAVELSVKDENAGASVQALDNIANELAEKNRIERYKIRLRILELKAWGKHLNDLDIEALQEIMNAAKADGAV